MNYYEPAKFPLHFYLSKGELKVKRINKFGRKDEREDEEMKRYYQTHSIFGKKLVK